MTHITIVMRKNSIYCTDDSETTGMTIDGLIKQLQDMLLLYGNKTILTISDGENEYDIKSIIGKPCAKYFEPKDNVAEVTITVEPIGRK